jgi:hypothetical protein
MVIGECSELPGGESRSIVGENSIGTASDQPVFTYPQGSFRAGDPSNYVVPQVNLPKPKPNPEANSNEGENSSTTSSPMDFAMTSDVAGTGSFTMRYCLEGQGIDNRAYQLTSAKYGNLNQSRELNFTNEISTGSTDTGTINYALAKIDIQDSLGFVGLSYNDIAKFKNYKDSIQDETTAGAISRTSIYSSQSLNVNEDDDVSKELINNYTVYNIDTKFVGSSNLHAITNGTEIMQSYIGQIAMHRALASQLRYNHTMGEDAMLECGCGNSSVFDSETAESPSL